MEAFADVYGMDVRAVTRSVVSARSRLAAVQAAAEVAAVAAAPEAVDHAE
ncbi:MAG: hypothetical protein ACTS6O_01890 [Giesbergeria sp.]